MSVDSERALKVKALMLNLSVSKQHTLSLCNVIQCCCKLKTQYGASACIGTLRNILGGDFKFILTKLKCMPWTKSDKTVEKVHIL